MTLLLQKTRLLTCRRDSFSGWQNSLENEDLRINADLAKSTVCSKKCEPLLITEFRGNTSKQVEISKYLVSYVNAKGESEDDVKHRIMAKMEVFSGSGL